MPERLTVRLAMPDEPMWWLTTVMYDTAAELQRAANKYRPSAEPGFWGNCAGCFQPSMGDSRYLGVMRLCREHLTADVVIHESVHAAVTYTWKSLDLKVIHLNPYSQRSMNEREEVLAHAVNGIACSVLKHLNVSL